MPTNGAQLHVTFERRAMIRRNGDIDEFFALIARNDNCDPFSFVDHKPWVIFCVTDSHADYMTAYDSMDDRQWLSERTRYGFVVGTEPRADLAPGCERSFGAHIFRRGRLIPSEHEIHFADPFLFDPHGPTDVGQNVYRVIAVFPERVEGWALSTPMSDSEVTSRSVTWEFSYDQIGTKQLSATAKAFPSATASDAAMLLYDDIVAELHVLIGRGACAYPYDDTSLQQKIQVADHDLVKRITTPLLSASELSWRERLLMLRQVQQTMSAARIPFARSVRDVVVRSAGKMSSQGSRPAAVNAANQLDVFVSYAPCDDEYRAELEKHLTLMQRQGLITTWSRHNILAGADYNATTVERLARAHVVLLLISVDFLASDHFFSQEMLMALARHERREARVIPILIRSCDYEKAPFARLKMLPDDLLPIKDRPDADAAFTNVARGIRAVVEEFNRIL